VVLSGIERGSIRSIKASRAGCEEGCSSADGYGSAVVGASGWDAYYCHGAPYRALRVGEKNPAITDVT
jgi:hypothetical protein